MTTPSLSNLFSPEKFLNYNECLVYIESNKPFDDTTGVTHVARVIRAGVENDISIYELDLLTDSEGDPIYPSLRIKVTGDTIVSDRSLKTVEPKRFFYFSEKSQLSPSTVFDPLGNGTTPTDIVANNFVLKDNRDRPLEQTSRSALGSGIYGIYAVDEQVATQMKTSPIQDIYIIECSNGLILQDKEHGESLTTASIQTNRYLDRIIQAFRFNEIVSLENIANVIRMNSTANLLILWNILLYRVGNLISQATLESILSSYVLRYLESNTLVDTKTQVPIEELPVNDILRSLGYDGILASDSFNNGWDRGCVSYDYSKATVLKGDMARY